MIAGLILAAGGSRRFGQDKRAIPACDGQAMLHTVLARFSAVLQHVYVVIPVGDAFGEAACRTFGATPIVNAECNKGMGSSLALGIKTISQIRNVTGVIIGLADMPWVESQVVHLLAEHLQHENTPVVPSFNGQLGHPRGIPSSHFPRLLNLSSDEGARHAIDWQNAHHIDVNCEGVVWDIDTESDLAQIRNKFVPP